MNDGGEARANAVPHRFQRALDFLVRGKVDEDCLNMLNRALGLFGVKPDDAIPTDQMRRDRLAQKATRPRDEDDRTRHHNSFPETRRHDSHLVIPELAGSARQVVNAVCCLACPRGRPTQLTNYQRPPRMARDMMGSNELSPGSPATHSPDCMEAAKPNQSHKPMALRLVLESKPTPPHARGGLGLHKLTCFR